MTLKIKTAIATAIFIVFTILLVMLIAVSIESSNNKKHLDECSYCRNCEERKGD